MKSKRAAIQVFAAFLTQIVMGAAGAAPQIVDHTEGITVYKTIAANTRTFFTEDEAWAAAWAEAYKWAADTEATIIDVQKKRRCEGSLQSIDGKPVYECISFSALHKDGYINTNNGVMISRELKCPNDRQGSILYSEDGPYQQISISCPVFEEVPVPMSCNGPKEGNPIDLITGRKEESIQISSGGIPVFLHYSSNTGWMPSFSEFLIDRSEMSTQSYLNQIDCRPSIFFGDEGVQPLKKCLAVQPLRSWAGQANPVDIKYKLPDGSEGRFLAEGKSSMPGFLFSIKFGVDDFHKYIVSSGSVKKIFDSEGRLVEVFANDGAGFQLTYYSEAGQMTNPGMIPCVQNKSKSDLPGQPACITDRRTGRQTNLFYEGRNLIRLIDPNGKEVHIEYNGPGALLRQKERLYDLVTRITFADQSEAKFLYNEPDRAPVDLPHALTSKVDENGIRFASFAYSEAGRAVGSEHSNGVQRVTVSNDGTSVTKADGSVSLVSFDFYYFPLASGPYPGGFMVPHFRSRSQPSGAGCAAATEEVDLGYSGKPLASKDFGDAWTCYSYDETSDEESFRVLGVDTYYSCGGNFPAGARKVSSEWLKNWHLKNREAIPGQIILDVYNKQPDPSQGGQIASCAPADATLPDGSDLTVLCKRVITSTTDQFGMAGFAATVDSAVAPQTWLWTYDRDGRVLTETDPKGHSTHRDYYQIASPDHWRGDLKSVVNAAGQITNYLRYDGFGNVLEYMDANGASTVQAYDARSRIVSITQENGRVMYEYWPTGLLKSVTNPDGSALKYFYDDAHRLTSMSDSVGNSVQYTLDLLGNVKEEAFVDAQGVTQRKVSRDFDALGRLSRVTGMAQ